MLRVCTRFVTGLQELLLGYFQLGHKLTEQLIYQLFELLQQIGVSFAIFTYLMDDCVFKFVLVICIENDAALIDKAHDWRDPAGAP
jgi:hypothetical protein